MGVYCEVKSEFYKFYLLVCVDYLSAVSNTYHFHWPNTKFTQVDFFWIPNRTYKKKPLLSKNKTNKQTKQTNKQKPNKQTNKPNQTKPIQTKQKQNKTENSKNKNKNKKQKKKKKNPKQISKMFSTTSLNLAVMSLRSRSRYASLSVRFIWACIYTEWDKVYTWVW